MKGINKKKVAEFIAANYLSPVVYGAVKCLQNGGARYRLADGKVFDLTRRECQLIPNVRWAV